MLKGIHSNFDLHWWLQIVSWTEKKLNRATKKNGTFPVPHTIIHLFKATVWVSFSLKKTLSLYHYWAHYSKNQAIILNVVYHELHVNTLITHWGQVIYVFVSNLATIGTDNCLLPGRHQAIIWISAGILLIGPLRTNFSETLIKIRISSFKKMHLKISSAIWCPFCLSLNVLTH